MKRSINIITLAIIVLAIGTILYVVYSPETASASTAFGGFPLNQPRVISFEVNKEVLEDKRKREKLDQVRDWLFYAVVSDSGQSLEQLGSEILFDLPATRDKYMRQVGNFEYGETRSRIIKEGEVVALVPADSSERIDQLAHIADEHRKNAGDVPKTVMVFDYKLNVDGDNIDSGEITRRDAIDGKELFTAKYGYYESRIASVEDLQKFLAQVDDVVSAQQDGDALRLGGRKILGYPYRGLGVQDIAAIWQSEDKIQKGEKAVDGSGFSLDPSYNFDKLKEVFDTEVVPRLEPRSYDLGSLDLDLLLQQPWMSKYRSKAPNNYRSEVKAGFARCDIGPFFAWLDSFRSTRRDEVEFFEALFEAGHLTKAEQSMVGIPDNVSEAFTTNQQARYDGDLQGTEVGMVLFYTDLVAKLWGFDYKQNTPTQIEDFRSGLDWEKHQSPAFPTSEARNGRLWFGPDDRGYQ